MSTEPIDAPAEDVALLSRIRQVSDLAALRATEDDDVNLILVDRSALAFLREGALVDDVAQGRAILGINVFHDELGSLTGEETTGSTREVWLLSHDGHGEGAYYSYFRRRRGQCSRCSLPVSTSGWRWRLLVW